jgi:drug/metabolite transporter (DMT)-like permease
MTSSETRAGPPRVAYLYLAVIVVTWAGNWPLMKLALADAPPMVFVLLRLVGTVAFLTPALLLLRAPLLPVPGERWGLFWVGQLQVAAFLIFSIIGLAIVPAGRAIVPAGRAIVLAYTFSLWAIPIGYWLGVERLGRDHLIGVAVGFAGLVLFMNPGLVDWQSGQVLFGNAMLLFAAIAWAFGSCLYRRRIWRSGFWAQTFWQLAVSTPVVAAVVLGEAVSQPVHWSAVLILVLAYNWVVTTALGYFWWGKVLAVMPASVAGQVLTLTPIGGFLLSTAMFGDAVTGDVILSIVLIVAGIMLTLRR